MSTALYATSSVGTSPPPSAVRPRLLDSTDSLALFPSVQRRQLRSAEDASVHRPASSSGFHRHFARLNARQAHENMIYSYGNHAGCPVEPTIATSASSYLNDDGRRIEIEKIPHGLVKQNRMLFAGSRPSSVSPQEQSSRMRLSRRTSEPFADEEPPLPRGMPTSSYLLRKSQENLLARRLEDEHGHQDPTYRTIIMFNDRSRSRRATFNAKVHSSPRSRSVGVAEHFVVARPALSVALESSPTPHSSEFLDIITQKKDDSPLSPNTIRRNCKHMMDFVNSRGCSLSPDEEGYESQEGAFKDSATNEEMISMSDALTNSQLLLTELQKPKNVYNSDGSLGSSSPSGSVISDVEIAKLKDDEIRRLEVELGNAQECNQQLMAQMGMMARKDVVGIKKALKDKSSECDALKKKVERAEKDRTLWEQQKRVLESKQPMDIQQLQSQKRELAIQLDREQSEKQELFMQINTLIAENAEIKCQNTGKAFEAENAKLKEELSQLTSEKLELTAKLSSAESELRHRSADVDSTRDELARARTAHELEKERLRGEVAECQKEIEMKTAALQSLRLAKQETNEDSEEAKKLRDEKVALEVTVSRLTAQLSESEEDHKKAMAKLQDQLERHREDLEAAKKSVSVLEDEVSKKDEELSLLRTRVVSLEENEHEKAGEQEKMKNEVKLLQDKNNMLTDQLDAVGKQLSESKRLQEELEGRVRRSAEASSEDKEALERRIREVEAKVEEKETEIVDLRREIVDADRKHIEKEHALKEALRERRELERNALEQKEALEELRQKKEQQEKDLEEAEETRRKLEEEHKKVQTEKMGLEKQLRVACDSSAAETNHLKSELESHVARIHILETQLDSQKDSVDEQVKQLRLELGAAGEKNAELAKELQDNRNRIKEIETEKIFALEEAAAKFGETESLWAEKLKESDSKTARKSSEAESLEKTVERLKTELNEKVDALQDSSEENESLRHELEKLSAAHKDFEKELQTEVVTLATSLQSVRDENASQQEEIANLRKRISALQDELHKVESERDDAIASEKSTNVSLGADVETLRADLKAQRESADARIGVLEAEKKVVDEEVRYLRAQLESATEDSKDVVEEATKKLAQQMDSLRRHNEKLANEAAIYSSLMEEKQARLTDAETRLTVQGEAVARLEAALQSSHTRLSETETKLKTIEETESGGEELESELLETRQKLKEAEGNIVDLNTQLHSSERARSEVEQRLKEHSAELDSLKLKLKELDETTAPKEELATVRGEKENAERKNQELEKELQKAREDLIANVNRFTEHLQIERERSDSDRKKSIDELATLQAQLLALKTTQTDIDSAKADVRELKKKVEELEEENRKLREKPSEADSERVAELVEENARLAGDLLKEQNRNARSAQVTELKREYEDELEKLGHKYSLQEEVLHKEISDLRKSIETDGALVRRKISSLESERDKLEEELKEAKRQLEKSRQNGGSPVPPPRRLVSSNSTVSTDTFLSERSTTPSTELDESKRLRAELDKSQRLVSVLRRKLQQATATR